MSGNTGYAGGTEGASPVPTAAPDGSTVLDTSSAQVVDTDLEPERAPEEEDSEVPDEDPLIDGPEPDERPVEDPVLDFPDTGDDSHADDEVEDPDVLDDDTEAVG